MQGLDPRTLRASIKIYRELVARQPDNLTNREQLGRLYLLAGRRSDGFRELEHVARARAARAEWVAAIELLREVLRLDPGRTEAALLLANAYAQAPEMASRVKVAAAVEGDPLDEIGRPDEDAPLDAASLVAVHEPEECGAEVVTEPTEPPAPADDDVMELDEADLEPYEAPLTPPPGTRAHRLLREALEVGSTLERTLSFTGETVDDDDILQAVELVPDAEPLPRIPLFAHLPPEGRDELADRGRVRLLSRGQVLVREGEPPPGIVIVLTGEIRLDRRVAGGVVKLASVGPGDFFGEVELLTGRPAGASATAATPSKVFVAGAEALDALRARYPAFDRALASHRRRPPSRPPHGD